MIALVRSQLERLQQAWLSPMPAERLALIRIAVGLYSLYYLIPRQRMFHRIARTSEELFAPVGLCHLLPGPISPLFIDALFVATLICAIFVTIGVGHRYFGPIFGLSLLALLSYRNSWSMILHMHNALVVHAMIIGFTPAADAWAVRPTRTTQSTAPSWRYGWAVRLVMATTLVGYFLSGVAKVLGPQGFAWASGEALRAQVAVNAIRYDVLTEVGAAPLFHILFDYEGLFWLMGIATLVLEVGAPLAMTGPRIGRLWVIATYGLHWGIFFTMGIKFRYQLSGAAFVAFFGPHALTDTAANKATLQRKSSECAA